MTTTHRSRQSRYSRCALALAGAALSGAALAATQGSPSTTSSTGNFAVTATSPATPRQVQVLNISDIAVNNSTRADDDPSRPGATMAFCLVDSYGGTVALAATTANTPSGSWQLRSADASAVGYEIVFRPMDNSSVYGTTGAASTLAISNPARVSSTALCGGGTIKAQVHLFGNIPDSFPIKTYSDTVTLVLTPQ